LFHHQRIGGWGGRQVFQLAVRAHALGHALAGFRSAGRITATKCAHASGHGCGGNVAQAFGVGRSLCGLYRALPNGVCALRRSAAGGLYPTNQGITRP
jgi:hypothetical protein